MALGKCMRYEQLQLGLSTARHPRCAGPRKYSVHHSTNRKSPRLLRGFIARASSPVSPFVDVAWLQRNLEDVRVYDVRGRFSERVVDGSAACAADYDAYLEGHIPGAVFVSWVRDGACWRPSDTALSGDSRSSSSSCSTGAGAGGSSSHESGLAPRVLAVVDDPDVYVPCFEARGLSAERPVVVYDSGTSMIAARVWWQLLLYGHPSPYILHGGWEAWREGGGALELYEPCPLKLSSVYDAEPQLQYRATADEFWRAAAETERGSGGADESVAVLLLPQTGPPDGATASGSGQSQGQQQPHSIRTTLSSLLLFACTGAASGAGAGAAPVPAWTTAPGRTDRAALAARLGAALGVPVGPGARTRLLLASPHDAALSACVVGALLSAAGHEHWAVSDVL